MSTLCRISTLKKLAAVGLMLFATVAFADNDADDHARQHGKHSGALSLNQGKQWETDTAVRQGMENIRQAMAASQEGIAKERLASEDYKKLGAIVEKNINDMVKNCKLPKNVDDAFHSMVLSDLAQGSELMRTATRLGAQRVGALGVQQALRNYGEYFRHQGWPAATAKKP